MATDPTTIRVNGSSLPTYVNFRVRLVGRVVEVNDTYVTLSAADSQPVQVHNPHGTPYTPNSIVEVIGKATGPQQVEEEVSYIMPDFDLDLYNQMLDSYHRNREIFY